MTATANTSPNRITVSGTGNTLTSMQSDMADNAYLETLLTGGEIRVFLMKVPLEIENTAVIEDHTCIWLHTVDSSAQAVTFLGGGGGRVTLGVTNPFTQTGASDDAPVTSQRSATVANHIAAAHYSFSSNNASQTWCAVGPGTWHMHGGMMRFMDDDPDANNNLYSMQFPDDFRAIQCNIEQWGGGIFEGNYRIQESTFKSSKTGVGFRPSEAGSSRALQDVIFHDNDLVFDLQSYSSSPTFRRVQLRGNTDDWDSTAYTGTLTLIDSDSLVNPLTGAEFGTNGQIVEANSILPAFVNDAGTALTDVRCLVYQTSSQGSVAYGSEQITTYAERIATRQIWNEANEATPLSSGSASLRARRYASRFQDVELTLGEKPIAVQLVMFDDDLTVLSEGAAAALSGIAIDEGNLEIDLTQARTTSQLYDYLHATQAASGNLDIPELFSSRDGNAYRMPANWSLTGQQNLDLTGKVIVGRYVPVTVTGVVNGAKVQVVRLSDKAVLASGTASGTSIVLTTTYDATPVAVYARLQGFLPFDTEIILSPTGSTVPADMPVDIFFTP